MSNINNLVEESFGSVVGAIGTAASGLGGVYTGGPVVGRYQSKKAESAQREIDKLKGVDDEYKSDKTGRHILASLGGAIPVVGAVTNSVMRNHHHTLRKELEELRSKKHKK